MQNRLSNPVNHGLSNMRQGFSLLELSIVLVIIGLITGGIMAGRSMVRAAELRSVMSDMSKYKSAVYTFREKYNALPGDMKNATSYWGALADGGPSAACATATPSGTATCNGNGNGKLEDINDSAYTTNENFRFWQHLANAGLLEGSFTGTGSTGSVYFQAAPSVNVPSSKITGAGYSVEAPCSTSAAMCDNTGIDYGNLIYFGTPNTIYYTNSAVLPPTDTYSLDVKMDDGLPTQGTMRVIYNGACSNGTGPTDLTATYILTNSAVYCSILFLKVF